MNYVKDLEEYELYLPEPTSPALLALWLQCDRISHSGLAPVDVRSILDHAESDTALLDNALAVGAISSYQYEDGLEAAAERALLSSLFANNRSR